ncbi:MAG: cell division protein ZipA [Gammaproteobacteria bacterium]
MDNLRWILLLSGILLIMGIFIWEVLRRRHSEWDDPDRVDRSFATDGDGLFAEPANSTEAQRDAVADTPSPTAKRDDEGVGGGLRSGTTPISAPPPRRSNEPTGADPMSLGKVAAETNPADEPLICAIAVMAKPGHRFSGGTLCAALEEAGLHYGPMGIFHYYKLNEQSHRQLMFSAANMLEPGSFDLDAVDSLYTPGLMLFMRLPSEVDGAEAFDLMLTAGKQLAERLGGELRDETRSSLTPQSIGHMRERIIDFGRKRLLTLH